MDSQNPYEPPRETDLEPVPADGGRFERGTRKGPALYIVLFGLFCGMLGVPLLIHYNRIGLALPLIGCVAGGFIYRIRSRHWPVDPAASTRQLRYILASMTLLPGTIFFVVGWEAQGAGIVMIGVVLGLAVSVGILASGNRRHSRSS